MIYPVIFLLIVICTIVTLFLIKESFKSERKKIFFSAILISTCLTIIFSIFTVSKSFKESEYNLQDLQANIKYFEKELVDAQNQIDQYEKELVDAQNQIDQYEKELVYVQNQIDRYEKEIESIGNSNKADIQIDNQPIVFDNIPCFALSKNQNDTELNDNGTKFIFYNHPEENNIYNTATFSFDIEKYNFFSGNISINDNINSEEKIRTTIYFYNETSEQLCVVKLNDDNHFSHIYLDISNLSTLTITIKTKMVDTKDNIFRTVSFSDINIQ